MVMIEYDHDEPRYSTGPGDSRGDRIQCDLSLTWSGSIVYLLPKTDNFIVTHKEYNLVNGFPINISFYLSIR